MRVLPTAPVAPTMAMRGAAGSVTSVIRLLRSGRGDGGSVQGYRVVQTARGPQPVETAWHVEAGGGAEVAFVDVRVGADGGEHPVGPLLVEADGGTVGVRAAGRGPGRLV